MTDLTRKNVKIINYNPDELEPKYMEEKNTLDAEMVENKKQNQNEKKKRCLAIIIFSILGIFFFLCILFA